MSQDGVQNIAVIGGGIIGLCSAISLLEAGQKVTLFEKGEPGQATSYGNAGIISPWSIVPQSVPGIWKQLPGMLLRPDAPAGVTLRHGPKYLPWLQRFLKESSSSRALQNSEAMHLLCGDTVSLYRQLLQGTGYETLVADAMYVHAFRDPAKADLNGLAYRIRRDKGADIERINAADLRDLEPALSHDYTAAILIKGQARALNPGKLCEVLAKKVKTLGGVIRKAIVRDLKPLNGQWQVTAETGSAQFEKVVLAAGIWSAQLLKQFNIRLPLAAERGYHVAYPDAAVALSNSVMDTQAHAVASSMDSGMRIAGIAEFSGLNTPPSPRRIRTLQRTAEAMLPGLKGLTPKTWMGIRPSFPDSLPLIQEFADHPGLIGAFGHSHYGLMMAPKTGRIVADIATQKLINIDVSPFRAGRF